MTREEQIIEASQLYAKHQQKPFMDGALWADSHPDLYSVTRKAVEREREHLIDKACEWVEKFAYNSVVTDNIGEREKQAIIICTPNRMKRKH